MGFGVESAVKAACLALVMASGPEIHGSLRRTALTPP